MIVENPTYACDHCGVQHRATGRFMREEVIVVKAMALPLLHRRSNTFADLHIPEILDRDYHFCNLACLIVWARGTAEKPE